MGIIEYLDAHSPAIAALATVVIAFFSVASVFFARTLAKENRLLRKVGTEPQVVAYLLPDPRYIIFVHLVIANIGHGAARNVRFDLDADPEDFKAHDVRVLVDEGRKPIALLPQGEKFVTYFGRGPELLQDPKLKPFTINVTYENVEGNTQPSAKFPIDIAQFEGLQNIGTPPEHEIAKALKEIAKNTGNWTSGFQRFKVETITTEDLERQRKEALEARREEKP